MSRDKVSERVPSRLVGADVDSTAHGISSGDDAATWLFGIGAVFSLPKQEPCQEGQAYLMASARSLDSSLTREVTAPAFPALAVRPTLTSALRFHFCVRVYWFPMCKHAP